MRMRNSVSLTESTQKRDIQGDQMSRRVHVYPKSIYVFELNQRTFWPNLIDPKFVYAQLPCDTDYTREQAPSSSIIITVL